MNGPLKREGKLASNSHEDCARCSETAHWFQHKNKCRDCGRADPEPFMVHDELWARAGMTPLGGFLCLACLENRLGRMTCIHDFTKYPINNSLRLGHRLRKRAEYVATYGGVTGYQRTWGIDGLSNEDRQTRGRYARDEGE